MHLFYSTESDKQGFTLDENESRHLIKVLRLKEGDLIRVINGSGYLYNCRVVTANLKATLVEIIDKIPGKDQRSYNLHIAIAPTKNSDRFEFFVEKCVELGIDIITPIICERSERKILKTARSERIIVSAMKQSVKSLNTKINQAVPFTDFIKSVSSKHKYIAHCIEGETPEKLDEHYSPGEDILILIGPEGDFSPAELDYARKEGYKELDLGSSRLRTETAGIAACSLVYFLNQ